LTIGTLSHVSINHALAIALAAGRNRFDTGDVGLESPRADCPSTD